MEYFWKQYEDLPAGMGFERFSATHLMILAVLMALVVLVVIWFVRLGRGGDGQARQECEGDAQAQLGHMGDGQARQDRVLRIIPWLMILLECVKDGFLMSVHHFGVGYLPLHLCGLGAFVFLAESLARSKGWQTVFSEISVTLILPGSIAALLFPDWVHLYPVLNFMNLYGFVWHGLLLLYPLLLIATGRVHLSVRHAHYDALFLLCVAVPVYCFDRAFRCNYMFLNWPPKGTPLEWIAQITGEQWYLAGYAVFACLVLGLIYTGVYLVCDRK